MTDKYVVEGPLNCWRWTGYVSPSGTPMVRTTKTSTTARRWLWKRKVGAIPPGMRLMALCDNQECVRPRHCAPVDAPEFAYRKAISKLDRKRAALALRMGVRGYSNREVADAFGVSEATIRRIRNGTHWSQRDTKSDRIRD